MKLALASLTAAALAGGLAACSSSPSGNTSSSSSSGVGAGGSGGTGTTSSSGGTIGGNGGTGGTGGIGTTSSGGAGGTGGVGTGGMGTGGASTGGMGTGGTGGAAATCTSPADCPAPPNECVTAACTAGQCTTSFVAAGTLAAMQTMGDCHRNQCDGSGHVASVTDDTDVPDDSNPCTTDACNGGVASHKNVAAGMSCGASLICDGMAHCVGCITATDCPGQDNACQTRTCTGGMCGFNRPPSGTVVASAPGDCHANQCDGNGNMMSVVDNGDLPADDGNACTLDVCQSGAPAHPNKPQGAPCNQNGGTMCDGAGQCVQCVTAGDCAAAAGPCQVPSCNAGMCGFAPVAAGPLPAAQQTPGDCKVAQCDGAGHATSAPDDTDVPNDNNACTADTCSAGAATFTPLAAHSPCSQNGGTICDGAGQCVQCVTAGDCPGTDNPCHTRTCTAGVCGAIDKPSGTVLTTTPGDCHSDQCDGAGHVLTNVVDDTDVPVDGNTCTGDVCTNGVPSNPNLPVGAGCTQSGTICDGNGACVGAFTALRVGAGTGTLSSAAAPLFLETRLLDGTLVAAGTNPLPLPTAASGASQPIVLSGTSTSEGGLARSADGHFLTLAGYAAAPATAAVVTTAGISRVVARVGAGGAIDTTTTLTGPFGGSNVRGAVSSDGSSFWVSGAGGNNIGGVWLVPFQGTTGTQITGQGGATPNPPNNVRFCKLFFGQLYCSSGSSPYTNVFSVGSGAPTAQATATALPGMPTTGGSPYGFVAFDLNAAVAGVDTLYVADDRSVANGGGVQKWTFDGTTWTLAATFAATGITSGYRGITGWLAGGNVVLIATSAATSANQIVEFVDSGTGTPATTSIVTAAANTIYRGVALPAVP